MTLLAIAALFVAVVVLPGAAVGVVSTSSGGGGELRPGVLGIRCLAWGVSIWLLVAGALVRLGALTATSALLAAVILAVGSIVVLALPRSRAVWRGAGAEAAYVGALAAVALLAWAPVGALMWRTTTGTIGSTPWFYWGLARQIVAERGFPETSVEFATTVPYLADYPMFSSGTALTMAGVPGAAHPAVLTTITMLAVVSLGVGAAVLARTWGASRAATFVAAPLVVTVGIGAYRLLGYRPEGFGLGLSLLVVALFVDWFLQRDRVSLATGCVLGAVLSQVHGVAFVGMAIFLTAAALAIFLTSETSWRFVKVSLLSAVSLVAAVLASGLLMGRISGSETSGGIVELEGTADPTWLFRRVARGHAPSEAPSATSLLQDGLERLTETTPMLVVVVAALGAVVLVWRSRQDRAALAPLAFVMCSGLLILAVVCVFVYGWDSYVPRRTGSQRILLESTLVVPVFLACAVSALAGLVSRPRLRGVLLGGAVVAALVLGFTTSQQIVEDTRGDLRPSASDHQALSSLDLPADAIVLANGYTEGYIGHVAGANGLLEGRAPYTFPDLLSRSLDLLEGAREFYVNPEQHLDFLDHNGVTHVAVSQPGSFSLAIKTPFYAGGAVTRMRDSPRFTEVASTPDLAVFEYHPAGAPAP